MRAPSRFPAAAVVAAACLQSAAGHGYGWGRSTYFGDVRTWADSMKKKVQSAGAALEDMVGDIKDTVEGIGGWHQGRGKNCGRDSPEHARELGEMRIKVRMLERQLGVAEAARSEFYGELSECRIKARTSGIPKALLDCPANLSMANAQIARLENDCRAALGKDGHPAWTPGWRCYVSREAMQKVLPVVLIALLLTFPLCFAGSWDEWWDGVREAWPSWKKARALNAIVGELRSKVRVLEEKNAQLQYQLAAEVGDMITVDSGSAPPPLRSEFSYTTFDTPSDQDIIRTVKIQVPGVDKRDVRVQIIYNGCIVTIERQAAPGVEAILWTRTFKFRQSDGYFEFKEDEASLERGYLQLVFHGTTSRERVFRFPREFDMSSTDYDAAWNFDAFETPLLAEPRTRRGSAAAMERRGGAPHPPTPLRPAPTQTLSDTVPNRAAPRGADGPQPPANDAATAESRTIGTGSGEVAFPEAPAGSEPDAPAEGAAARASNNDTGSDEVPFPEAPSGSERAGDGGAPEMLEVPQVPVPEAPIGSERAGDGGAPDVLDVPKAAPEAFDIGGGQASEAPGSSAEGSSSETEDDDSFLAVEAREGGAPAAEEGSEATLGAEWVRASQSCASSSYEKVDESI